MLWSKRRVGVELYFSLRFLVECLGLRALQESDRNKASSFPGEARGHRSGICLRTSLTPWAKFNLLPFNTKQNLQLLILRELWATVNLPLMLHSLSTTFTGCFQVHTLLLPIAGHHCWFSPAWLPACGYLTIKGVRLKR